MRQNNVDPSAYGLDRGRLGDIVGIGSMSLSALAPWSTIDALVRARARDFPDRASITIDGESISYSELDRLSDIVGANMQKHGLRKGDRVCSLMFNRMEQLLVWMGTIKAGGVWAPLNVSLIGQDLAYTIKDAQASLLFVDDENAGKLKDIATPVMFVVGEQSLAAAARPFVELLRPGEPLAPVEIAPGDPAVIIYTGGTTGMPKGVVLPHFAWIAAGLRYQESVGVTPSDIHFSVLSMFHVGGLMAGLIAPMVSGIPTTLDRWFSASSFWRRVAETGATIIDPIGTMLAVLAKAEPNALETDHKVRVCLGSLGQLPEKTVNQFRQRFRLEFLNLYSLSEAGGLIAVNNPVGSPKPLSNGRDNRWTEIRVVDENDAPLAPHVVGEILLRPKVANTFMLRYHNNPGKTAEVWRNLWLHTGDLGYLDEDGYLFFTGRQAHFLRRRGENISCYEVENALRDYPGIGEVVVVGVPSELGEDDVKAFIIPRAEGSVAPAELFRWCEGRIASFKIPRYIEMIEAFPRSATKQEVERHKLKALPHTAAWDAEAVFGRRSTKSAATFGKRV